MTTPDLVGWLLLGSGALMVGFAKTSFGGAGSLAAVCFAAAIPARESTGALLPLLIAGDLLALSLYPARAGGFKASNRRVRITAPAPRSRTQFVGRDRR